MTIDTVRDFLLWCFVLNYGILMIWYLGFTFMHDTMEWLMLKMLGRRIPQMDTIHVAGMTFYKLTVVTFTLVPWLALTILR